MAFVAVCLVPQINKLEVIRLVRQLLKSDFPYYFSWEESQPRLRTQQYYWETYSDYPRRHHTSFRKCSGCPRRKERVWRFGALSVEGSLISICFYPTPTGEYFPNKFLHSRGGQIHMEFSITNKAMQPMADFAIQLNKNSFGVAPAGPLQVIAPLPPGQTSETSVPLNTNGIVQRMEPLNSLQVSADFFRRRFSYYLEFSPPFFLFQVAIKNNIDVFYFACLIPVNVFFAEDGEMDKRVFLSTWKDIPSQNEVQFTLSNISLTVG